MSKKAIPTTVRAEAEKLREELNYHTYRYYSLDDPVIADRMHEARMLINRDAVDAQAQLEVV